MINGWPVRPSLATPGRWLIIVLRTNPRPGARAEALDRVLADEPTSTPESILDGCGVGGGDGVIARPRSSPTRPCDDWDVRP
jgi:hypothetical protein